MRFRCLLSGVKRSPRVLRIGNWATETGDGIDPDSQDYAESGVTDEDNGFTVSDLAIFNNQGNVTILVSTDGSQYTVIGDSFAKTFSAVDSNNQR